MQRVWRKARSMRNLSSGERTTNTQTYTRRTGLPEMGELAAASLDIRRPATQEGAQKKVGRNIYQHRA
eukprot:12938005-Prorocentrum_lima.AAC.1